MNANVATMTARAVLAFDVASPNCSAVVWRDGTIIAQRMESGPKRHAERLVPLIGEVMDAAAMTFDELEAIAVTVGPGSFTGVRIGLATAKGLALATNLPVIGVTSFAAVAFGVSELERSGRNLLVVLETKRTDFYCQAFSPDLVSLGPPAAIEPEALHELLPAPPMLLVGDGVERAINILGDSTTEVRASCGPGVADAAMVAAIAAGSPLAQTRAEFPSPLYLRPPNVRPAIG